MLWLKHNNIALIYVLGESRKSHFQIREWFLMMVLVNYTFYLTIMYMAVIKTYKILWLRLLMV